MTRAQETRRWHAEVARDVADIPVPNGCAACGIDYQEHAQRWHPAAGRHGWLAPTDEQRLARMQARREARDMEESKLVPEEAWRAAVAAHDDALDNPTPGRDSGRAALEAAAPLIRAAELDEWVAEFRKLTEVGELNNRDFGWVADELASRAAALRDGSP